MKEDTDAPEDTHRDPRDGVVRADRIVEDADAPAPDSIICDDCGGEIIHDDYVYGVIPCYNMHGDTMARSNKDDKFICESCRTGKTERDRVLEHIDRMNGEWVGTEWEIKVDGSTTTVKIGDFLEDILEELRRRVEEEEGGGRSG